MDETTLRKLRSMLSKTAKAVEQKESAARALEVYCQVCVRVLMQHDAQAKVAATDTLSQLIANEDINKTIAGELVRNKFVENVLRRLDEDSIRRFEPLLIFLTEKGMFSKEHMLILCDLFIDNLNGDLSKWILHLIKGLLPYCDRELLLVLGDRLKQVKVQDYSKCLLELLGAFAMHAEAMQTKSRQDIFDLNYIWSAIFEGKLRADLADAALDSLVGALSPQSKREYITFAGINFLENLNIELTIKFLLKVKFLACFRSRAEAEDFVLQNSLVQRCIDSCVQFHAEARRTARVKLPEVVPQTGLSLLSQAKIYLDFLQTICAECESCKLSRTHLDLLWVDYCRSPFSNEVADLFWNTVSLDLPRSAIGLFSSKSNAIEFFKSYLMNSKELATMNLTTTAFNSIKKYFELANASIKSYSDLERCQGLDTLWMVALTARDFRVQMAATDYIVDLYYSAIKETAKAGNVKKAVEDSLDRMLASSYKDVKELKSALHVVNKFAVK